MPIVFKNLYEYIQLGLLVGLRASGFDSPLLILLQSI